MRVVSKVVWEADSPPHSPPISPIAVMVNAKRGGTGFLRSTLELGVIVEGAIRFESDEKIALQVKPF